MFIQGNINYTYSGRKKNTYKVKKVQKPFIPLNPKKHHQFSPVWWEQKKSQPKSREFFLGQIRTVSFTKRILVVSIQ